MDFHFKLTRPPIMNLSALEIFPFEKSPLFQSFTNKAESILLFAFRIWLFNAFFFSGMTKMSSWETTLMLFEYEYEVPFIPFNIAAYLATAAELLLPALLLVGIFSRFTATGLFVLNIVAAISYPDISPAGTQQHIAWGLALSILMIHAGGKITYAMPLKLFFKNKK